MRRGRAPGEAFSHCDCATSKSVAHCAKLRDAEMSCETAYGTDRWASRAHPSKSLRRRRDSVILRRRSAMRHALAVHRVRCARDVDMSPCGRCRFLPAPRRAISVRRWRGSSRRSSRPACGSPRIAGAMARCRRTSCQCRPDRRPRVRSSAVRHRHSPSTC
jgi:hypothetical protein